MKKIIASFILALFAASVMAQGNPMPFVPSATVSVAVTASAQTVTLPQIAQQGPLWQYVMTATAAPSSGCTQPTFFTVDGTTATVSNGMPVMPNSAFIISLRAQLTSMSVIGGGTGCTLYVTAGVGQ